MQQPTHRSRRYIPTNTQLNKNEKEENAIPTSNNNKTDSLGLSQPGLERNRHCS